MLVPIQTITSAKGDLKISNLPSTNSISSAIIGHSNANCTYKALEVKNSSVILWYTFILPIPSTLTPLPLLSYTISYISLGSLVWRSSNQLFQYMHVISSHNLYCTIPIAAAPSKSSEVCNIYSLYLLYSTRLPVLATELKTVPILDTL